MAHIIYEQPLNEHIRLCLRLEYLFQKLKYSLDDTSSFGARIIFETILEILTVVDRPDLKTKLSKALTLYANPLNNLLNKKHPLPEEVDEKKLHRILDQINRFIENLHLNPGKIGQILRENDFITSVQQRYATAGGTCAFSSPSYHLWLQQSAKIRNQNIADWIEHFTELKSIVTLILKLTRESASLETALAKDGFYQINLDPAATYQMVRIELSTGEMMYPEVSVGRHRLSVYFNSLNVSGRPSQITENVRFELACCKL